MTKVNYQRIGKLVRHFRRQRGWSQAELGQKIGYATATVSQLEAGRFRPPIETLLKLADVFGIPVTLFFTGKTRKVKTLIRVEALQEQLTQVVQLLRQQLYKIQRGWFYFSLTGNIGVGKSQLLPRLAKRFEAQWFGENAEKNPFLPKFYQSPKRWAFLSELWFFGENFRQQAQMVRLPGPIIQGRSLFENYHIFVKVQAKLGWIKKEEVALFEKFYQTAKNLIKIPDFGIIVRRPLKQLWQEVKQERWFGDPKLALSYLKALDNAYLEWTKQFTLYPLFVVDGKDLKEIEKKVEALVKKRLSRA